MILQRFTNNVNTHLWSSSKTITYKTKNQPGDDFSSFVLQI